LGIEVKNQLDLSHSKHIHLKSSILA